MYIYIDKTVNFARAHLDGQRVERFACLVEGCGFTTKLGPGALRMHLLLKADPMKESRYCSSHEEYCRAYEEEIGLGKPYDTFRVYPGSRWSPVKPKPD